MKSPALPSFVTCCLLFLFLLTVGAPVNGQEKGEPFVIGETHHLQSELLGQERPLIISLPESYAEGERNYPVLYLLDGDHNFHHTTATVRFLSAQRRIPEMIVVGIPNTDDRTRDLTPPTKRGDNFPTAGGADKMMDFLQQEVMAYVNQQYRAGEYQLLVGHSFGGLFAIHALLNRPGIFDGYLAISPSLWWDDQDLVTNQSSAFFEQQQGLSGQLFMTMGDEGGSMLGGALKLTALLEEKAPENLHWKFVHLENETHGSVPLRSTYEGLEFIFEDYNQQNMEDEMEKGILTLIDYEQRVQEQFGVTPVWRQRQLLGIGKKLFDHLDPALSVDVFRRATELFPEEEEPWILYGESLVHTRQPEAALKSFEKARAIDPQNMQTLISLKRLGADVELPTSDYQPSARDLSGLAGSYLMEPGFTLRLELEGEQLWVHAPETAKEAIFPLERDVYFLTSKNAKLIFERADDGSVSGMRVETPGPTFSGKRLD